MAAKSLGTSRRSKSLMEELIKTQEVYTISELVDKSEAKRLVPEVYQRAKVWSSQKQKNLCKGLLLGAYLTIPPIWVCKTKGKHRTAILDGLQRITAFQNFINNNIKFKKDEFLELINDPSSPYKDMISPEDQLKLNKYLNFKHLPEDLQSDLLNTPIRVINLGTKTINEQATIFQKINMGNPVNRSQKRKGKFIVENNSLFKTHIMACSDNPVYVELFKKDKAEIENAMVAMFGVYHTCRNPDPFLVGDKKTKFASMPEAVIVAENKKLDQDYEKYGEAFNKDINHIIKVSKIFLGNIEKTLDRTKSFSLILVGVIAAIKKENLIANMDEITKKFKELQKKTTKDYSSDKEGNNDVIYQLFYHDVVKTFSKWM